VIRHQVILVVEVVEQPMQVLQEQLQVFQEKVAMAQQIISQDLLSQELVEDLVVETDADNQVDLVVVEKQEISLKEMVQQQLQILVVVEALVQVVDQQVETVPLVVKVLLL
jgi:hypothetical protein